MQRFINHWRRYVPVSTDARNFLLRHAQVLEFGAGDHFLWEGDPKPYWCFVLKGLVFGYSLNEGGRRRIRWFAPPMVDFTGIRHLHTRRPPQVAIQFALPTTVLRIPATHVRAAKRRYREVNELLHILKQKRIDHRDLLIEVLQEPVSDTRFSLFMKKFRSIERLLDHETHMDFISLASSSYYRAKFHYLHNR